MSPKILFFANKYKALSFIGFVVFSFLFLFSIPDTKSSARFDESLSSGITIKDWFNIQTAILHDEIAKLIATDASPDDFLGSAVAISGDTVVVGAPGDDAVANDSGSAYVFSRNQEGANVWGQVIKLTANDGDGGDYFGASVAISGEMIAIGAKFDESAGASSGSVYLFARNQNGPNNWGPVKKILSDDISAGDEFGYSIALDGDTLVVGARLKDIGMGDVGGVYIFKRNEGGVDNWGQVAFLEPPIPQANQQFGFAVGISNDKVVIGSPLEDEPGASNQGVVYIYARNQGGPEAWGLVNRITANDGSTADGFGGAVGISGDVVVVGARLHNASAGPLQGAAYVFARNRGGTDNWGQVKKITAEDAFNYDEFGNAIAISDDTIAVGSVYANGNAGFDQGAVYVFRRNNGGADNWGQAFKLTTTDAAEFDNLGFAVSISGDTIITGAPYDDHTAGEAQGSAYIYVDSDLTWEQSAKPIANDANTNDGFGYAMSLSGDTLAVGSRFDDTIAVDTGSVYIFERNSDGLGGQDADNWGLVKKITPLDRNANDQFGWSVNLYGDTLIVGANLDDEAGTNAGALYVFRRNQGGADNWGQVKKITAPNAASDEQFGFTVSLYQETLVAGIPYRDGVAGDAQGAVFVFSRNLGGADNWGLVTELIPSLVGDGFQFGHSVSISRENILVGAPYADPLFPDQGIAFIFSRNVGGADQWNEVAILLASDAEQDDHFGFAVGISNDTATIGVPDADDTAGINQGTVHIFARNAGGMNNWGLVKIITAEDAAAGDQFGKSIGIDTSLIAVGAPGDDDGGAESGSAYLFERNIGGANQWGQSAKLIALDAHPNDTMGTSIAISGRDIAAGAPENDHAGSNSGASYVFQTEIYEPPPPPPTLTPTLTLTPSNTPTETPTPTTTSSPSPTPTFGPSPTPSRTPPPSPGDEWNYLPLIQNNP